MRTVVLACIAATALAVVAQNAAAAVTPLASRSTDAPSVQTQEIDDNDDTRVEVQLVVLGVVAGTVFVLGSCVYLLRKRLGLVAPPPEQGGSGHH
jgi:hypothetical protein